MPSPKPDRGVLQSSVTYAFRLALSNVRKALPASLGRVVLQMHDEIIVEVAEGGVAECVQVLRSVMETSLNGVAFPVTVKCGPCWGQLQPFPAAAE